MIEFLRLPDNRMQTIAALNKGCFKCSIFCFKFVKNNIYETYIESNNICRMFDTAENR